MEQLVLVCLRFSFSKLVYKTFLGFFIFLLFSSSVIAKPQFVPLKEFLERYSQKHSISVFVGRGIDLKTRVNLASMPENPEGLLTRLDGRFNSLGLFNQDGRLEVVKLYQNNARETGLRLNSQRQKMKKQKVLSKRRLIEHYFQMQQARNSIRRNQLAVQMRRNGQRQFLASSLILNARKRQPVIRAERTSPSQRLNDEAVLQDSESLSATQVASASSDPSANNWDVANSDSGSQQESSGSSTNLIGQTESQTGGNFPLTTTSASDSGTQPQGTIPSNLQGALPIPNQQQNSLMQSLAQANAMRGRYQFNPTLQFQYLTALTQSEEIKRILSGTVSVRAP